MNVKDYDARTLFVSEGDSVLGRGSFASVYRCSHNELGRVAVKCINSFNGSGKHVSKQMGEAKKRIDISSRLRHRNIIEIFGVVLFRDTFGIIMEEAIFGNLFDLLIDHSDFNISWVLRVNFFWEIANGLDYLHNHDPKKAYIHKDLKSENVLITTNMTLKLADFGSFDIKVATGALTTTNLSASNQYTAHYSAPEYLTCVLNDTTVNSTRAMDVYSFAIVGYEIITRHIAFEARCKLGVLLSAIAGGKKPQKQYLNEVEASFKDKDGIEIFLELVAVMEKCWDSDPELRPAISEVCQNLYVLKQIISDYEQIVDANARSLKELFMKDEKPKSELIKKVTLAQYLSPIFWDKDVEAMTDRSAGSLLESYTKPFESGHDVLASEKPNQSTAEKSIKTNTPKMSNALLQEDMEPSGSNSSTAFSEVKASGVDTPTSLLESDFFVEEMVCYDMDHEKRGVFLIFANDTFHSNLNVKHRDGASKDIIMFQHIAQQMGFEYIRVLQNCTIIEMLDWVRQIKNADHSHYDCFGCAILTYGYEGDVLLATDGRFRLEDFVSHFTSENCPTLAGKPKLFFVNACRGYRMGPIASPSQRDTQKRVAASPPSISRDIADAHPVSLTVQQAFPRSAFPHLADFVIVYSTIPGYASWRNSSDGSWFVQALSYCFNRYVSSLELMQILTRVSKMVSTAFVSRRPDNPGHIQYPSILSHLTAEVHF